MEIKKEYMIGQGNTAEIYRLDDNKILKLFRHGISKEIIEREYRNGNYIQNKLDCIPKVYDMVEINDRLGIIYEEIKGTDMLKVMVTSLWKINDYAKKLAHYHLDLQIPIINNICTVKEKLEEDVNAVDVLSNENKEIVRKYLMQLPEGDELCHFDFHPGNIMITDNKAVFIDWMTACRGDACADVARTCIMLKYGEVAQAPWVLRKLFSFFQHHIYKIYIKEYLMISKRNIEDINRWELPVAAARLREWLSDNEKRVMVQLVNEHCEKIATNQNNSRNY
ncbi:aminoglycoside phosphotransferase family protein [Lachnoclostridium phytofermentans]|uniref:aminoglycoside phosphotransferase family protein n=1 Tax=Lachnoclostridium phytofermentans TaxID=66219 RepID=UPI000497B13F|nr:aminoglycoside phosphotransferase family protein [Lachnoclostridium phytofermentans]